MLIIPIALFFIFMILYLQFRSPILSGIIFSSIFIALSGGMIFLYLYSTSWFLNFPFIGDEVRDLFNVKTYHLSVAVWVGFLALFGIASDDGVVISTYLEEIFKDKKHRSLQQIREAVIEGALKRALPSLMTTATTLIALIPVISSRGRGSDVMVPMALPIFGGMVFGVITMFVVPVLYSWVKEREFLSSERVQDHIFGRLEGKVKESLLVRNEKRIHQVSKVLSDQIKKGIDLIKKFK